MSSESSRAEFIAARNAAMAESGKGWEGHDALDPKGPSGHAYGIGVSTRLTSYYRETHRKQAMDVTPREVIDCLTAAGVKNWVLMGLHGYVGYLPMPRATQDVDVMVPHSQKKRASKAIHTAWPTLEMTELSRVVRFMDPGDLDPEGKPKPVIDIMLPWSPFQETILKDHVLVDEKTGDRIPTIEAAVVSKYAAIVSPYRDYDKKAQDVADIRKLIKANHKSIDSKAIESLANQIWDGGDKDILEFVRRSLANEPFEI